MLISSRLTVWERGVLCLLLGPTVYRRALAQGSGSVLESGSRKGSSTPRTVLKRPLGPPKSGCGPWGSQLSFYQQALKRLRGGTALPAHASGSLSPPLYALRGAQVNLPAILASVLWL